MLSCRLLWASGCGVRDKLDETIADVIGLMC